MSMPFAAKSQYLSSVPTTTQFDVTILSTDTVNTSVIALTGRIPSPPSPAVSRGSPARGAVFAASGLWISNPRQQSAFHSLCRVLRQTYFDVCNISNLLAKYTGIDVMVIPSHDCSKMVRIILVVVHLLMVPLDSLGECYSIMSNGHKVSQGVYHTA